MDFVGALVAAGFILLVLLFLLIAAVITFAIGIMGIGAYYEHFAHRGGKSDDSG
jgi:hypothetical protein